MEKLDFSIPINKILGVLFILSWLIPGQVNGCTSFFLKKGDQFLLAKNLDWPIDDGIVFVNKRAVFRYRFQNVQACLSILHFLNLDCALRFDQVIGTIQ